MKTPSLLRAILAAALAAHAAACANAPAVREPPPLPFTGPKWMLVTERKLPGEPAYLEFGDGAVTGFSGCNRVMGRYVQDAIGAGAIIFSTLSTTKRMCEDPVMAVEERMIAVLRSSTSVFVKANTLQLDGSAGTLRFIAAGTEAPPLPK